MAPRAAACPVVARAQQPEQVRRIGVLAYWVADDAEGRARLGALIQGLQLAARVPRQTTASGLVLWPKGAERCDATTLVATGAKRT